MIKKTTLSSYECKIYMGIIDEVKNKNIRQRRLIKEIQSFQSDWYLMIPVRLEKTIYLSGNEYIEKGYVISAINYPRIRETPESRKENIRKFMEALAERIILQFNQKRVSIVDNYQTAMYESLPSEQKREKGK